MSRQSFHKLTRSCFAWASLIGNTVAALIPVNYASWGPLVRGARDKIYEVPGQMPCYSSSCTRLMFNLAEQNLYKFVLGKRRK
jgi:hypothetical protein